MKLYGIWQDDGNVGVGWLRAEGKHYRSHRCEYATLEEAEEEAERQTKLAKRAEDRKVFLAMAFEGQHEVQFRAGRSLFNVRFPDMRWFTFGRMGRLESR